MPIWTRFLPGFCPRHLLKQHAYYEEQVVKGKSWISCKNKGMIQSNYISCCLKHFRNELKSLRWMTKSLESVLGYHCHPVDQRMRNLIHLLMLALFKQCQHIWQNSHLMRMCQTPRMTPIFFTGCRKSCQTQRSSVWQAYYLRSGQICDS